MYLPIQQEHGLNGATIGFYRSMLFLDDFLEMLEELPVELRDRCTEIREIDLEISTAADRNRRAIREFFDRAEAMTEEQRAMRLKDLQNELQRLRKRSEEKVALAERMQELLEKYTQHLEKEKTHFKFELEADNPGVTEMIEKRFSDYVEQMIAMRKERRKRHHTGTSSNGTATSENAASNGVSLSSAVSSRVTGSSLPSRPAPSKAARLDSITSDNGEVSSPTLNSLVRSRKPSVPLTGEELIPAKGRRDSIRAQLSLSSSTGRGISPGGAMATPAERSAVDRWTPASSRAGTPMSAAHSPAPSHHSAFTYPPSTPAPSTPSPASSAMPNFTGSESRHGRPRKLTSRVQEMFNSQSSLGHRERPRHHPPSHLSSTLTPSTPSPVPNTPNVAHHPPLSHHPHDDEEGEEETGDERTYCFCNEKSYGGMVACDNKECPYEWFHLPCVQLDVAPKGKWFCPHCSERLRRAGSQSLIPPP